jgi:hypothetical protein
METKPLHFYSRTAVTTDWKCPRQRFWNYQYQGRGLSSTDTALELFLGIHLHDGLAALASGTLTLDQICKNAYDDILNGLRPDPTSASSEDPQREEFANEQATLITGLLYGFGLHVWPRLQAEYPTIVAIEKEFLLRHDAPGGPIGFMAKPDLLLRNKDGALVYFEYKSTSSNKEQWALSWNTAIQLHSAAKVVSENLGEPVDHVVVQGLYKGYVDRYGRQSSPICYAYYRQGVPPFSKDSWTYEWTRGYERYPTWRRPADHPALAIKAHIQGMPSNMLAEQFPVVPPIVPSEAMVQSFFKQRAIRESKIRDATLLIKMQPSLEDPKAQAILDEVFPQTFEACSPSFGKGCNYRVLCHGKIDDPLNAGFQRRSSHHAQENSNLAEQGD